MKYINNKIIAFTLIAASIMSCTDEYNCQLQVEKPQNEMCIRDRVMALRKVKLLASI